MTAISDREFAYISEWLYDRSGIRLKPIKKQLVTGRLDKRLRMLGLQNYAQYFRLLERSDTEREYVINQLTTNETYFFRERQHFDFLVRDVLPQLKGRGTTRFWSAAASTGAEAYTLAFCLAQQLGVFGGWQIIGTDINTEVLAIADRGIYPLLAAEKIPQEYLRAYCLKGKGKDKGFFKIHPDLMSRVRFHPVNLFEPIPIRERFDVVFLRNVLIYFEPAEKARILNHVVECIRPGGWLIVGHSESIYGFNNDLEQLGPGCYRRH